MSLCCKCKKNKAVVFIASADPSGAVGERKGYCMTCARELNIKPISDMLNHLGISDDEQMDEVNDQLAEMMENMGIDIEKATGANIIMPGFENGEFPVNVGAIEDDDSPERSMLESIFGRSEPGEDEEDTDKGKSKKKKK